MTYLLLSASFSAGLLLLYLSWRSRFNPLYLTIALFLMAQSTWYFAIYQPAEVMQEARLTNTQDWTRLQSPLDSLEQWNQADFKTQRAKAYLMLSELRKEKLFQENIRSTGEYKPWAIALTNCINQKKKPSQSLKALATACLKEGLGVYKLAK